MCSVVMVFCTTCEQTLCNCTNKYFVLGLMRWFVSISMQFLLSSNVRQVTLVVLVCTLKPFYFSSSSKLIIPITSQNHFDSAIYLSSVVLSVIKYCIFLAHIIGQPAYIITYLIRKWLDKGSSDDPCCHELYQSVSTYHSNTFFV